jgi:hypothetical protein
MFLVERFVPMAPVFKYLLYFVLVIAIIIWLLQGFGLLGSTGNLRIR